MPSDKKKMSPMKVGLMVLLVLVVVYLMLLYFCKLPSSMVPSSWQHSRCTSVGPAPTTSRR